MPYTAEIFNIMLASPNDVNEEREAAYELIYDWNNIHSLTRKVVILPLGWEYNTVPTMGDRPQKIINQTVLENADILVGIFWTRIGTPTGKAISGSVEEIEEHIKAGKDAMLYFSNKPVVPSGIDHEQYGAVRNLRKEYQSKGLTEDFDSLKDFKIKFQRHLSLQLNKEKYLTQVDESITFEIEERKELSEKARILLKETSLDSSGQFTFVEYMGGFEIQANRNQLNEDDTARTLASWKSAVDDLLNLDLIEEIGYEGNIFRITDKGFQKADTIK